MLLYRDEVLRSFSGVPTFGHALNTEVSNEILFDFARLLLDRLSEAAWGRVGLDILAGIASNDVPYLCNLDPSILDLSAADQSVTRQCLACFSKRADVDIGLDRKGSALGKFRAAEASCAVTNSCFRAWSQGRFQFLPDVEAVLHGAQYKISSLLGPAIKYDEIRLRFGPGATTATPKKNASPIVKIAKGLQCSTNFPDSLLEGLVSTGFNPATREDGDVVEVGIHLSKLTFVPKNAKVDRAICTEPVLNGMYQLGLGDWVASRLRRVGVDIKDQSLNQRAALYGSISGASATLDLSSASDTIALGLVKHLFSDDWYDLFSRLRTSDGMVEGELLSFEKISSMGNGFTFPLETLIFWALAQSVKDHICPGHRVPVRCYGDDIIVPTQCVALLTQVLTSLGFTLNLEKSFWEGNFRESCGHDYVFGIDVRPIYVKEALNGADFFRLRNFFYRKGDYALSDFWENRIEPAARIYGPDGFGDGHLVLDHYRSHLKATSEHGSFTFQTYGLKPTYLARRIADKFSSQVAFRPPKWCVDKKKWIEGAGSVVKRRVYHDGSYVLARTLATYTQYARETRVSTLTRSDALSHRKRHVYADRRMPEPQTRDDEDFFVTPGAGTVRRIKIYIFESLPFS